MAAKPDDRVGVFCYPLLSDHTRVAGRTGAAAVPSLPPVPPTVNARTVPAAAPTDAPKWPLYHRAKTQ